MSGYDLNRFVDLSHTDVSELTCSICQDVLRCPVVTNCCLQTFCKECIKEWLETKNTCPYDRKELNKNQLSRPPRLLTNMLGKMKIRCINESKGCKEIFTVDQLDLHEKSCPFDKPICDKCKCHMDSGHDCVESLLESNRKLTEASNKLKLENANYLKTIQNLHSNNTNYPSRSLLEISDYQIIIEARNYLNSAVIDTCQTSMEISYKIISIVKNVLKEQILLSNVCEKITQLIHLELDGQWNCQAFYDNVGYNQSLKYPDFSVRIDLGKLSITVYKAYDEIDIQKLAHLLRSGKILEELTIEKSNFDEFTFLTLREIIFDSIKISKNLGELSINIIEMSTQDLGGNWHCFVYKKCYANFSARGYKGKYISLTISDLKILIFQNHI